MQSHFLLGWCIGTWSVHNHDIVSQCVKKSAVILPRLVQHFLQTDQANPPVSNTWLISVIPSWSSCGTSAAITIAMITTSAITIRATANTMNMTTWSVRVSRNANLPLIHFSCHVICIVHGIEPHDEAGDSSFDSLPQCGPILCMFKWVILRNIDSTHDKLTPWIQPWC